MPTFQADGKAQVPFHQAQDNPPWPTSEDVGQEAAEGSTVVAAVLLEAHFSRSLEGTLLAVSWFSQASVRLNA